MEIDFFIAKHRHSLYKLALQATSIGLDDTNEEKFVSKSQCEFCIWVNKFLINDYKNIPEVEQLLDIHENIHMRAQTIFEYKKSGNKDSYDKIKSEFEKIEKQTKTIISLIDRIENEIKLYK